MKFICFLTMTTVFLYVQNRQQTEGERLEVENESSLAEELLMDFCKN